MKFYFHEESFILAEKTQSAGIANSLTGGTLYAMPMKSFLTLMFFFIVCGCRTSSELTFSKTESENSVSYIFKNSKTIVFKEKFINDWLINQTDKKPYSITESEIIALNLKLEKDYYNTIRKWENSIDYSSLPDASHYSKERKASLNSIKEIQKQMPNLNKQLVGYIDSLGHKVIAVNIVGLKENQTDLTEKWIGNNYEIEYDVINSRFTDSIYY